MLFVNGEQLKLDTPEGRKFTNFKDNKLKKMKNPVVFKSGKPIKINKTGLFEPPRQEWIPFSTTINGENGSETWQYTSVLPIKKDNQWIFSERGRIYSHGRKWKMDKNKDSELIYFMGELSPFVKSGKIILENKEHEARTLIDKEIGILDVKFFIYSDNSPLSVQATGGEETLRIVASSWGVEDVDGKSLSEIQIALHKAVEKSHPTAGTTGRGYTEFLSETRVNELVVLRANVQRAIDKDLIEYAYQDLQWKFTSSGNVLMTISQRDIAIKEIALFNHIKVRPELRDMLMSEMAGNMYVNPDTIVEGPVVEDKKLTPQPPSKLPDDDLGQPVTTTPKPEYKAPPFAQKAEGFNVDNIKRADLDGLSRKELNAVCKKHVINSFGKSTVELTDKLKQIYKE